MTGDNDRPKTHGSPTAVGGLASRPTGTNSAARIAPRPQAFDVVVAGGGLAGVLTALALAEALGGEADIALVAPEPAATSAGHGAPARAGADPRASSLSAATRNALEALGIWHDVSPHAQPIHEIRITDSALDDVVRSTSLSYENAVEDTFSGDMTPGAYIAANDVLAQAADSALHRHPSVRRVAAGVTRFAVDGGRQQICLTNGQRLSAALLIAADGRGSRLRRMAGIKTVKRDHKQSAIVAMVSHSRPHHGVAVQHFLPSGPFAILPMVGDRSCVTWSEDRREVARLMAAPRDELISALELRFGGQLGGITLDTAPVSFPLMTVIARDIVADRFALVGDALRAVHPIAGQGVNLAVRDIAALVESVADGMRSGLDPADAAVLSRYSAWRRFDSVTSAAAFAGLNDLFSLDNSIVRSARTFGLGVVNRLPAIKSRLVNEAAGLSGETPKMLRGELV